MGASNRDPQALVWVGGLSIVVAIVLARQEVARETLMATYDVRVHREDGWWMVSIPELDGLTQGRTLAEAEQAAREYIAVTLDVPLESVEISVDGR